MPLAYKDTPESEAIARIGYDPVLEVLTIVFRDKEGYPEYEWLGIDNEMAMKFLFLAGSKGRWYHRHLYRRVEHRSSPVFGSRRLAAIGRRIKDFVRR